MSSVFDTLDSLSPEQLQHLAIQAAGMGDLLVALQLIELAAWQEPDNPQILRQWGEWLALVGQLDEAIAAYEAVLTLAASDVDAISAIAEILNDQGRFTEALNQVSQAEVATVDLLYQQAIAQQGLGQITSALDCCNRALQLDPTTAKTQFLRSKLQLAQGNWLEGWADYESRLQVFPELCDRLPSFGRPLWQGEDLTDKTLLVWGEQGYGDQIQFVRYLFVLRDRWPNTSLLLLVSEPLVELFRQLAIANLQVATEFSFESEPTYHFHVPLLSLPQRLKATIDTIPLAQGYLPRSPQNISPLVIAFRKLQVGFVWQAGETADRRYQWRQAGKSVPLDSFWELRSQLDSCQFWSLQVGVANQSLQQYSDWESWDLSTQIQSFADTAALLSQLDLLITVDTAIAHLAGALGIPTWVLLPKVADWRWGQTGVTTPWYKSVRLYRQTIAGDWQSVFELLHKDVEQALATLKPC